MFLLLVGGVADPVRLAIINRIIGASDRGRLSGAERSIISLNGVIAPSVFGLMFAAVVGAGQHALPGRHAVLRCAALMIPGFAITVWALNRSPTATQPTRTRYGTMPVRDGGPLMPMDVKTHVALGLDRPTPMEVNGRSNPTSCRR